MNKTDIEWCDQTWNPITGCLHKCPYCYARGIARRFTGKGDLREKGTGFIYDDSRIEAWSKDGRGPVIEQDGIYEVMYALTRGECPIPGEPYDGKITPYPFGFTPTLHRYRLTEPQKEKTPQNVFVGSMADVFGEWVPDEWITAVFDACAAAPQHRYIFLTKNPCRYNKYYSFYDNRPDNFYFGASASTQNDMVAIRQTLANSFNFLSIEPMHENIYLNKFIHENPRRLEWVVIGAETGNRKEKIISKRIWIEDIVKVCAADKIPVFMKNSLATIWGEPLIQEYPWK